MTGIVGRIVTDAKLPYSLLSRKARITQVQTNPVPVEDVICPWVKGYLFVADHPFVATSDTQGFLSISELPIDKELQFRIFHEGLRFNRVLWDGEERPLERSLIRVKLKAGVNDLGEISLPSSFLH